MIRNVSIRPKAVHIPDYSDGKSMCKFEHLDLGLFWKFFDEAITAGGVIVLCP